VTRTSTTAPRMTDEELVSVVIPAYNAAATLDETLRSVRAQTHRALEIIVVDDGSTDDTRAVAQRHAAVDDRVRVVSQENAGLAASRNAGWTRAQSEVIAFVDADDLWAPTKIERQLERLRAGGERVGLVYCGSVRIDGDSMMAARVWDVPRFEGDALDAILAGNFIGNGSAVLVRRQALVDARGFESGLRSAGAEGCEDYLFSCRVAERFHFAVAAEHLVGYRDLSHNMSSNRPRMLRSWIMVFEEMLGRHPGRKEVLTGALRHYSGRLARDAVAAGRLGQLPAMLLPLFRAHPGIATQVLLSDMLGRLIRRSMGRLVGAFRSKAPSQTRTGGRRFVIGAVDGPRGMNDGSGLVGSASRDTYVS
jgi:glycosyltransferase involved in cell wall biosynthesis